MGNNDLRHAVAAAIWETWRASDIGSEAAKDIGYADLVTLAAVTTTTDVPRRLLQLALDEAQAAIDATEMFRPDPWIDIQALGPPTPGTWPWNGKPVLIRCASLREGDQGQVGEARFLEDRQHNNWDWWWHATSPRDYVSNPIHETNGPVTHVRRLLPPGDVS